VEEITPPRLLEAGDETQNFECGVGALNEWLKKRALLNHLSGASRTYVATAGKRIVAYYCLSAGSIQHAAVPGRIRRNMPEPIPALVLGRLAVDVQFQRRGLGPKLILDAIDRTHELSTGVGIRALVVNAKNEQAAHFYKRFGFTESPIDPLILMALVRPLSSVSE
jgi:ribosomal protein S18 acetylase RimI-like enzyme